VETEEKELLDSLINYDSNLLIKKYGDVNEGHADYANKLKELVKIASCEDAMKFLAAVRIAAEGKMVDYFVQYEHFRADVVDAVRPARVRINAYLESSLLEWLSERYAHPESLINFEKDGYGVERHAALIFPEKLQRLIKTLDDIVTLDGEAINEKTAQFLAQLDCDIKSDTGKYREIRDGVFRYSVKNEMECMSKVVRERIDAQKDTQTLEEKSSPLSNPTVNAQTDYRKPSILKRIIGK